VRFVKADVSIKKFVRAITRDGGEILSGGDL
jgi:hypothetical protein